MPIEAAGRGSTGRRRRTVAPWAALLLAVAPLPGAREVPPLAIASQVGATSPMQVTAEGLAFDVDGWVAVFLPLAGAEAIQIDYRAAGNLLLTWGSADGTTTPSPHFPPWHHEPLPPGTGRRTLELRTTNGWATDRVPYLYVEGTGTFVLTGLRARPAPEDPAAATRSRDDALRWAPIRVAHTTINLIEPQVWLASRDLLATDILAGIFLAGALGGTLSFWAWKRRWRPGPFVAGAAVATLLLGNVAFAIRIWPALALRPQPDAGARLRENLHFNPELGALAALAREQIRPGERVGVITHKADWFAWESLCFHLAPRPCARMMPGSARIEGLQGLNPMRIEDLDVVVSFHGGAALPPGFRPVAALNRNAFLARRR
jgi:hypothetical protein